MPPVAGGYSYLNFIVVILALLCLCGFFWALVNVLRGKFTNNGKLVWTLVVLFAPLGWLIYLFVGRKQRIRSDA